MLEAIGSFGCHETILPQIFAAARQLECVLAEREHISRPVAIVIISYGLRYRRVSSAVPDL